MDSEIMQKTQKLVKHVGVFFGCLLLVFETIICVQFINVSPLPAAWSIVALVGCSAALDVLYFVELFCVKTFKGRVVIYCIDYVFLLFICALTGSTYIAVLYCVILTQLYMNIQQLRIKIASFGVSCGLYVVTCIIGWLLASRRVANATELTEIVFGCITGFITLAVHFAVTNFLISFYRNNLKLSAALKEADESKAELEAAYEQLSETAVFQERNRIARDIHDNAGHSMTAVIMQTEAAKLLIDSDPEQAKAKIISANIQAKNALEQMRDSVHLLAGDNAPLSLKAALEEIILQTMDGTDVKVRYDLTDLSLSGDRQRFICNTLKECLSNGMRHGGATAFYVELSEENGVVGLTVSDNGSGLPDDFKEGFGLRGIREKAAGFGGSITLESEEGDGCEIRVTIAADNKK